MTVGSVSTESPVLVTADWRTIPASKALAVRVGPASNKIASNERDLLHARNPSKGLSGKGITTAFGFPGNIGEALPVNR
jgi:hypothetical protein